MMNEKLIEHVGGYDWPYKIKDDGTAEIIGKPSPSPEGALVIPEKLGGCAVTSIGDEVFADCGELTTVTIPVGVTRIGDGAFADCGELTTVAIPVGVTSIGEEAFARCRWLEDVVLPFGVTTIEDSAFFGCSGLKAVTIPSSVAVIGRHAFHDCDGLTVTMENGVTTIRPTALTVRVSAGDAERVRKLLADAGVDTSKLMILDDSKNEGEIQ